MSSSGPSSCFSKAALSSWESSLSSGPVCARLTARARPGRWSSVPPVSSETGARKDPPTTSSRSTSSLSDKNNLYCNNVDQMFFSRPAQKAAELHEEVNGGAERVLLLAPCQPVPKRGGQRGPCTSMRDLSVPS